MSTNPFVSAIASFLMTPIDQIKTSLSNVIANPTLANAQAQGVGLLANALDPATLEKTGISGLAQEALNLVTLIESHLSTASAAPTAAAAPAATTSTTGAAS